MADARTWGKRVVAWRRSGETAAVFAARGGYAQSTLRGWASRLRRSDAGLVRVVMAAEPLQAERAVELDVDGVRVHVRTGFDRAVLSAVLDVLRARSPS